MSIRSKEIAGYIARSAEHPRRILTTGGEMLDESLLGPGARCAKVYKTERGALKSRDGMTAHAVNEAGIEIAWLEANGY